MSLCFAMTHCDRDASLAGISSAALKSLYPGATVLVIEDKPRLKLPLFSGQWTKRWMEKAMATGADIVVKLDPDTRAMRTVSNFPASDVFGQLAAKGDYFPNSDGILSGACIGFQAAAVKRILDSGILTDAKYTQKPYWAAERRYGTPWEGISLQDPIVADVMQRLNLASQCWEGLDLMMSWEPPRPFRKDATFVHPVVN